MNWLKNLDRPEPMVGLTGLGVEEVQCARWKMEICRETGVRMVHAIHPRLESSCKSGSCEIAIMSSIPSFWVRFARVFCPWLRFVASFLSVIEI